VARQGPGGGGDIRMPTYAATIESVPSAVWRRMTGSSHDPVRCPSTDLRLLIMHYICCDGQAHTGSGRTRLRADRLEVGRCLERGQLPALPRAVIHAARAVETGPAYVAPSGTAVAYLTSVDHQVVRLGSQGLQIDRILGATVAAVTFVCAAIVIAYICYCR
jgi:hypothetical protein